MSIMRAFPRLLFRQSVRESCFRAIHVHVGLFLLRDISKVPLAFSSLPALYPKTEGTGNEAAAFVRSLCGSSNCFRGVCVDPPNFLVTNGAIPRPYREQTNRPVPTLFGTNSAGMLVTVTNLIAKHRPNRIYWGESPKFPTIPITVPLHGIASPPACGVIKDIFLCSVFTTCLKSPCSAKPPTWFSKREPHPPFV